MQSIENVELTAVDIKRLANLYGLEIKKTAHVTFVDICKCRIFFQETSQYGLGRIDGDLAFFENFLESSGVVVCVAVCENDTVDKLRADVRVFEPFGRVDRRVDHDAAMVEPDNEA